MSSFANDNSANNSTLNHDISGDGDDAEIIITTSSVLPNASSVPDVLNSTAESSAVIATSEAPSPKTSSTLNFSTPSGGSSALPVNVVVSRLQMVRILRNNNAVAFYNHSMLQMNTRIESLTRSRDAFIEANKAAFEKISYEDDKAKLVRSL